MPAWRSILVLAKGSYGRGTLLQHSYFEENKDARGSGGYNQSHLSLLAMFLSSSFINLYDFFRHLHIVLFHFAPDVPVLLEFYFLAALRSRGALMNK